MPTFTFLLDFIAILTLFVLAFVILRAITDLVSKVRVKFKTPVEYIGGVFFALWVGWVMVCFTTMTLHMAPLSADFMGGALSPDPQHASLLGYAPDHQWLAFVHRVTGAEGSLSTSASGKSDATNTFDPQGEFVTRYGQRRVNLEATPALRVNR